METPDGIEVRDHPEAQRFEAHLGDGRVAVVQYRLDNDIIIFTHTEVPEEMEGRGVAGTLVRTALEHAREHGYAVVPMCPFVASYIRRHRQYRELVMPRFRYMV